MDDNLGKLVLAVIIILIILFMPSENELIRYTLDDPCCNSWVCNHRIYYYFFIR